jgi:peptidyl-prolyl cis-trans isomerase A (cyclophilin A)
VGQSNTVGMVSFATSGPNTRTTQMFINYGDNSFLNKQGFTPFGRIEGDGMDVIRSLHVTGEGAPGGPGPNQGVIQRRGNSYLEKDFPEIDYIKRATFVRFNEV